MATKELTKTMTFGLGAIVVYDKGKRILFPLDDADRKKIYESLFRCFRDFAKLCNYTTSLYYSQRIKGNLHFPLDKTYHGCPNIIP